MVGSWEKLQFKKDGKYYNVSIEKNLFGTDSVICSWGNSKTKLGNYKVTITDNEAQARELITDIKKRRIYRGYKLIS